MKIQRKLFSFLLVFFTITVVSSQTSAKDGRISGEVRAGFRILEIDPTRDDSSFVVYRGDYIKFQYPGRFGELSFAMADLNYSGTAVPDLDKTPYYKMKKVGTYGFSLGSGTGVIEVIDLVRPNYVELTAKEAQELLNNRKLFILDVRMPQEYQQLHLKDSYLIPIQELQSRLGELQGQKHEDIFVYCATGNRSTVAAKIMADAGFKRIYNLRFGIHDWARKGHTYDREN